MFIFVIHVLVSTLFDDTDLLQLQILNSVNLSTGGPNFLDQYKVL